MHICTSVTIPHFIYQIYANAAKNLQNCTTEEVLSAALIAYANYLFDDMVKNGEIMPDND